MTSPRLDRRSARRQLPGFTLVELLVAIAIVGMVLAVSVPVSTRFYQSIQYRQAVRDLLTTLGSARQLAINTGRAQDVAINPDKRVLQFNEEQTQLPDAFRLAVHTAREVNRDAWGVIRFYPEGGSSGGDIDVQSPTGRGVTISVDWLMGSVSQQSHEFE